jgi:hypothetical protein
MDNYLIVLPVIEAIQRSDSVNNCALVSVIPERRSPQDGHIKWV